MPGAGQPMERRVLRESRWAIIAKAGPQYTTVHCSNFLYDLEE